MLLPDEAREITRIVSDPPPSEKIAAAQKQFEPTVDAIQTMSARDFRNLSETEKIDEWRGQFPRPHDESDLFWRGIVVGLDGSLLFDNLNAYVLAWHGMRAEDGHGPIQRIDYFHALIHGIPMAQMYTNKEDVHATEMISTYGGFTVQRVINFQRRWRVHRPQISGFALVD